MASNQRASISQGRKLGSGPMILGSTGYLHTAPFGNCQPQRALEWPTEGTTEALASIIWGNNMQGWWSVILQDLMHEIRDLYVVLCVPKEEHIGPKTEKQERPQSQSLPKTHWGRLCFLVLRLRVLQGRKCWPPKGTFLRGNTEIRSVGPSTCYQDSSDYLCLRTSRPKKESPSWQRPLNLNSRRWQGCL